MKSLRNLTKAIANKQNEKIEKLHDLDNRVSKLTITMAEHGKVNYMYNDAWATLLQSDVDV